MLKRSAYTLLFPSFEDSAIIFNSASGRLCRLSARAHELGRGILWRPNFPYRDADRVRLREEFVEKGFLVDSGRDELRELRASYQRARADRSACALTLAPTRACNLECVYCYEGRHEPETWSAADEDAVVAFAARELAAGAALSVTWYGGEPLLALPIVLRMSGRLRDLAVSRRATWSCDMVTNGTLLTPDTAEALAAVGCMEYQITLDGPKATNDRLRPSRDGSSTFDRIVGNITRLDLRTSAIGIRINLMRDNAASIGDLVRDLSALGLAGQVGISLAPMEAMSKPCRALADRVVSPEAFADLHFEFLQVLEAEGFSPESVPMPVSNYCGADCDQAFVIDWRGDVFRCWNDVGDEDKRLGSVHEPAALRAPAACR
ncbi:MAG: radical SAM protein [Acidobacteria bacterium]|nr:radical SAM protein [Acidobacteriota bacterium]